MGDIAQLPLSSIISEFQSIRQIGILVNIIGFCEFQLGYAYKVLYIIFSLFFRFSRKMGDFLSFFAKNLNHEKCAALSTGVHLCAKFLRWKILLLLFANKKVEKTPLNIDNDCYYLLITWRIDGHFK